MATGEYGRKYLLTLHPRGKYRTGYNRSNTQIKRESPKKEKTNSEKIVSQKLKIAAKGNMMFVSLSTYMNDSDLVTYTTSQTEISQELFFQYIRPTWGICS